MTNPTSNSPELRISLSLRRTFRPKSRISALLKSLFPTVPTLVSVAFGFGLKAWWDESQAKQLQHVETQRAFRALNLELQQNIDENGSNMQIVDNDIVASDRHEEVIIPMSQLSVVEGQAVALRGSLEPISIEESHKLSVVYAEIVTLNQVIQHREFYSITNQSLDNFDHRRKLIDGDLRTRLIDTQTAMILLQKDLRSLHDP